MAGTRVSRNFLRALVEPKDADIDIVAVHGLNTTNNHFQAEETWTAGGKLWLRDFLPERLPKARILLFGYNSNVAFESSTAGVEEQAENLLNRLKMKRKEAPHRPLIFICHSLGGIVVKRALLHAKLDETYESIRSATYGIAFFSTPHQGGNYVSLGDVVSKIVSGVLRNPTNSFLEALKVDSLFGDLIRGFRQQQDDYVVLSFYETLQTKSLGLVVDKKSATLGLPGKRETQIAMDADHIQICKFERIDDDRYEQVVENLVDLCEQATKYAPLQERLASLKTPSDVPGSGAQGSVFLVPYPDNEEFVGRNAIRQKMKERLTPALRNREETSQKRVALYGLGGVGKSQIALKVAYWAKAEFPEVSVFWVHAGSRDRFQQSMAQIALECSIPGHKDTETDIPRLVKTWLERKDCRTWVMIMDNADDAELFFPPQAETASSSKPVHGAPARKGLGEYIPECSHGSILITTRNKQAAVKLTRNRGVCEVEKMNGAEVVELINDRLEERVDPGDAAILAEQLGSLPLALVQAIAFMQENSMTVHRYSQILQSSDEQLVELLNEPFEEVGRDSEIPNAVTTTWYISFRQIKQQHRRASDLLSIMAFLDRQEIPSAFLSHGEERLADTEKALGVLKAFSFITPGKGDQSYDLHRLVQLVVRRWLALQNEHPKWTAMALRTVSKLYPRWEYENWPTCVQYLPHANAVLSLGTNSTEEEIDRADLLHMTATFLTEQGQWQRAEMLEKEAIDIKQRVLEENHPETLNSFATLGVIYRGQGRWTEAETVQLQAVEIDKLVQGDDHPDTLISMASLASTYWSQGRFNEAEDLNVQVLEIRKRVLGDDHPHTLSSMASLASTYRDQGRFNEAEDLEVQVLEIRKRVLGDDHPHTLSSMASLALTYWSQGRFNEAEDLDVQVLEISKRVLGDDHPHTLSSIASLALTYWSQGRFNEAEDLEVQVLEIRKRVLGDDHPHTLSSMASLASTYRDQGRFNEAEDLNVQVLEISKRVLGDDHPHTLSSMASLALTYWSQGRFNEAEDLGVQVLEIRKRVLSDNHPATLSSMGSLASTYRDQGRFNEAEDLEVQVLEIRKRVLGDDHPNTLISMNNLAWTWKSQGRVEEAIDLMDRCLQLRLERLGAEHGDTRGSRRWLDEWRAELNSTPGSSRERPDTSDSETRLDERAPEHNSATSSSADQFRVSKSSFSLRRVKARLKDKVLPLRSRER